MGDPLLVEFFDALPEDALRGGLDWPVGGNQAAGDEPESTATPVRGGGGGKARRRAAVHVFCKQVQEKYTEGTLLRVLTMGSPSARKAAIFALGLLGSPGVNGALAACLHDEDEETARLATEALWTLWFRGDNTAHSDQLYRLLRERDRQKVLAGLTELIQQAPSFFEAYNQRAVVYYRLEQYDRSAADCEAVLKLNPHHFGAQAGLGQCYLRMRKQRAALRAFRAALRINPRLNSVVEMVKALESALGEEGR